MKIMHIADLHIGKKLNGFSLIEDQKYILNQIIDLVAKENCDAVLIAGDVYDKSISSTDAVSLYDDFMYKLSESKITVLMISGNHDSPERISCNSRILSHKNIFISRVYDGSTEKIVLNDSYGEINFYLLPFIKPTHVKNFFPTEEISSYTDAVKLAVDNMCVETSERNILITHQFVAGGIRSESEDLSVGGTDIVDLSIFYDFDYVALGHLHRSQQVGKETVRYSGSPLKYSFSEVKQDKSVTILELKEKGCIEIKTLPLNPLHDMRMIKGSFDEIVKRESYINTNTDDYMHITLTDEEDKLDALHMLRIIYKNLMKLEYDNTRTRNSTKLEDVENIEKRSPKKIFEEFYNKTNGKGLTEEQDAVIGKMISEVWGE